MRSSFGVLIHVIILTLSLICQETRESLETEGVYIFTLFLVQSLSIIRYLTFLNPNTVLNVLYRSLCQGFIA